jgi:hypothetical protein
VKSPMIGAEGRRCKRVGLGQRAKSCVANP